MGYNYFYEMYNRQDADDQWKSYTYTYQDSPYLDETEIEQVKLTLDPLKFAREYTASFEDSGNSVFYCFKRDEHIDKSLPLFEDKEDVHVAIDFNVGGVASLADFKLCEFSETLSALNKHKATLSEASNKRNVQRLSPWEYTQVSGSAEIYLIVYKI